MAESVKDVLIVDDEEDSREFIKEALSSKSLSITCATDGEEGLRRITEDRPDLVILDVHMPKMDGFHVLHTIKKDEKTARIPVIMLTAVREKSGIGFSKDSIRKFMDVEPEAYIEKPIDPDKLKRTVESLLGIEA
jgi:two-component system, OmpR family, alkaline phosphatase synthesis response regulator PhoP